MLASKEEYIAQNSPKSVLLGNGRWSKPKYQCPECGGNVRKNLMVVLTSYPPSYEYQCESCGHIDYLDF